MSPWARLGEARPSGVEVALVDDPARSLGPEMHWVPGGETRFMALERFDRGSGQRAFNPPRDVRAASALGKHPTASPARDVPENRRPGPRMTAWRSPGEFAQARLAVLALARISTTRMTSTAPAHRRSEAPSRYAASAALFRRACHVIPGGYHLSGRPLLAPEDSPMYIERGAGSRCWDLDGNEYTDYVLAFGPHLLGYARPEVDAAGIAQLRRGTPLSMNHPLHVQFIERLVARFPGAEMGHFFRSGSEATTAALRIARRATGRRRVIRCGYHGWHDRCLPQDPGVPDGLAGQVLELPANEPERLGDLLRRHPGEVAAVIVAPEMLYPLRREVFVALAERSREHGAVFILDEVKTGFRAPGGSIQSHLGFSADLTTLGKALGNGWAVAAVVGRRRVMQHAAELHLSGTYHGDTAAMAAAMATLDILDREDVPARVARLGERLISGLGAAARAHGVPATAFAEPMPAMPFLRFEHPDAALNDRLRQIFYSEVLAHGVLFHPRHLWFLSHAHHDADVDATLAVASQAFASLRHTLTAS